jgi:hypothetical protein
MSALTTHTQVTNSEKTKKRKETTEQLKQVIKSETQAKKGPLE